MDFTIDNWLVLIINSDKERVTRGVDIEKKFFSTYIEAHDYMIEKSKTYKKAKEIESDKYETYVQCEDYFVQIEVIDCSKGIKIIG